MRTTSVRYAGAASFARRSGNVNMTTSAVSAGSESAATGGATSTGPSRPRKALATASERTDARRIARVRSRPAGDAGSPAMSMTAALVADVDHLLLGEEIEGRGAALAVAEARLLHAAERHLRLAAERGDVHVQHARLRLVGVPERGPQIVRVDRRGEPVPDGVRRGEGRFEV